MSAPVKKTVKKTPARIHSSMKKETMNPSDYLKYETRFSCEECSHFDSLTDICTIGYVTKHHRKAVQEQQYLLAGKIAFCRFHEID